MDFQNRIKKELTEGIVRAILTDAGYRVIDLGIENVVREMECLTALEYAGLDFPKAMKSLPDLLVMNKEQSEKYLVEIKYRSVWSSDIFDEIEDQVKLFTQLILVYLNSTPPLNGKKSTAGSYLRCCSVRSNNGIIEVNCDIFGIPTWFPRAKIGNHPGFWWSLKPMQEVFKKINEVKEEKTLMLAVKALKGILNA